MNTSRNHQSLIWNSRSGSSFTSTQTRYRQTTRVSSRIQGMLWKITKKSTAATLQPDCAYDHQGKALRGDPADRDRSRDHGRGGAAWNEPARGSLRRGPATLGPARARARPEVRRDGLQRLADRVRL